MLKLKELRKMKGLTQQQVADKLNIGRSTYAQYESNSREPDYETLINLANFYEVTVDYLLGNEYVTKENEENYDFEKTKNMVKKEFGDRGVLFYDIKKMTPEELKVLRAVLDALEGDKE